MKALLFDVADAEDPELVDVEDDTPLRLLEALEDKTLPLFSGDEVICGAGGGYVDGRLAPDGQTLPIPKDTIPTKKCTIQIFQTRE